MPVTSLIADANHVLFGITGRAEIPTFTPAN